MADDRLLHDASEPPLNGCPLCGEPIEYPADYRDPRRKPGERDLHYGRRLFGQRGEAIRSSINEHFRTHPALDGLELVFE
jgi:hypothetical protein